MVTWSKKAVGAAARACYRWRRSFTRVADVLPALSYSSLSRHSAAAPTFALLAAAAGIGGYTLRYSLASTVFFPHYSPGYVMMPSMRIYDPAHAMKVVVLTISDW